MDRDDVDIIVHAAAGRHFTMIEVNAVEGNQNNVSGKQVVDKAARLSGIGRFILVSTLTAAWLINVMGAKKRCAELLVHDAHRNSASACCAMVGFGKEIGSSWLLVALFHEQIRPDGTVIGTHPEVTQMS